VAEPGVVLQAALDVFAVEPPPEGHPLVGRPDVICTPHLGASTAEAQEDVSVEVAEVVVSALKVGGTGCTGDTAMRAPCTTLHCAACAASHDISSAEGQAAAGVLKKQYCR
jgi:D-3-phosphoglycerate dehydrogenase / 2-oxoglutarate reductase